MRFTDLRVNGLKEPMGMDSPNPEFQWCLMQISATENALPRVTLQVSRFNNFDSETLEWESSTINVEEGQVNVRYEGKPLESRTRYYWSIGIWDKVTNTFDSSAQSWFEMGLLTPDDWTAKWIRPTAARGPTDDEPIYLRGLVEISHRPLQGRAYATACGWYKLFINGVNVTGTALVPRWTPFDQFIEYQVYDITSNLRVGTNYVSIVVADGRFRGHLGIEGRACYGNRLAAMVQIEAQCDDGTSVSTGTNDTWESFSGQILHSDPKHGQVVDARRVSDEWLGSCQTDPAEEDSKPESGLTEEIPSPTVKLISEEVERVDEIFRIPCQSITLSPKGHQIIDFGQNITGIVEIRMVGDAGSEVTLAYSEIVGKDGEIDLTYLAPWPEWGMPDKPQQDTIYLSGEEIRYRPWFGIYGFRYVEVKGLEAKLTPQDVQGIILATSFAQPNYTDPNVFWSTLGNLTDTATDCPTRERMGWTGDIQAFVPTTTKFFYVLPFFRRYMRNLAAEQLFNGNVPPFIPSGASRHRGGLSLFGRVTSQSTGWGDASVIIPWSLYWYYGDESILSSQYESMCRWVDSLAKRACEGRSWRRWLFGGIGALEQYILDTGFQWGEWLRATDSLPSTLGQIIWGSPAISTAYLAHSADLLSRVAGVLGRVEDQALYYDLYQQIAKAWREAFVKDGDNGRADVAYRVLLQNTSPSWLYQVELGATTTWETWEGYDKAGNASMSHNHYAFGTVAQWLQEGVAGISPLSPGWRRIKVSPCIGGGLSRAGASVDTPLGLVSSSWNLEASTGTVTLTVNIPFLCSVEVMVGNGKVEMVGSGKHRFSFSISTEMA
ncbi:alpha-L-rhamnosidase A [Fusarium albosuccineum]|uniref:alpha-L-rhamnosidase n=1 Tax=Fusarium albosuccineum TaxID=1237068 RepID=A0A8H4LD67_9HYPO|nr:alpha-L-rhamnosidase A [Fusarium albosuccineum]